MSGELRAFWDGKYADDEYFYGTTANAWLRGRRDDLRPGMRALAIADGEGRNGVWLAEQGLEVTAVDASTRGLAKARALALRRGVALDLVQADLTNWDWPLDRFDLAVAIFAHFPSASRPLIHRRVLEALVPGGRVLLEAYSPYQLRRGTGGPSDVDLLYTAYRLQQDFAAADILELAEVTVELHEGRGHDGVSDVVRLVARRPR